MKADICSQNGIINNSLEAEENFWKQYITFLFSDNVFEFEEIIDFWVGYLWYRTLMPSGCKSVNANELQHCISRIYPLGTLSYINTGGEWLPRSSSTVEALKDPLELFNTVFTSPLFVNAQALERWTNLLTQDGKQRKHLFCCELSDHHIYLFFTKSDYYFWSSKTLPKGQKHHKRGLWECWWKYDVWTVHQKAIISEVM